MEREMDKFDWTDELYELIQDYIDRHDIKISEFLAFITPMFIGTAEMHGFSEEFMQDTLNKMMLDFKKKREKRNAK